LSVNGTPRPDVLVILLPDQTWFPLAALEEAGLRGLQGRRERFNGVEHVLLESLAPDVTFVRAESQIRFDPTAAPRLFATNDIPILPGRPKGLQAIRRPSVFLNYGATWQSETNGITYQGEIGASARTFSFVSGLTVDQDGLFARGLSTLTFDRPEARRRWMFG